jgi:hypothetical protein
MRRDEGPGLGAQGVPLRKRLRVRDVKCGSPNAPRFPKLRPGRRCR